MTLLGRDAFEYSSILSLVWSNSFRSPITCGRNASSRVAEEDASNHHEATSLLFGMFSCLGFSFDSACHDGPTTRGHDSVATTWSNWIFMTLKACFPNSYGQLILHGHALWPQERRGHLATRHDRYFSRYPPRVSQRLCRRCCCEITIISQHIDNLRKSFYNAQFPSTEHKPLHDLPYGKICIVRLKAPCFQ